MTVRMQPVGRTIESRASRRTINRFQPEHEAFLLDLAERGLTAAEAQRMMFRQFGIGWTVTGIRRAMERLKDTP